ncbi:hypothetical protein [Natronoglomus mannanivorans]|uniref:Uncharacterized protein n=1 Tax=Natronoglomus mannanivorans TaxID=2979990 RepID=A0AAP3E1T3_9EURY|nr:hypothetical protein [Halobacteria archaeon AArc-xg1-1]
MTDTPDSDSDSDSEPLSDQTVVDTDIDTDTDTKAETDTHTCSDSDGDCSSDGETTDASAAAPDSDPDATEPVVQSVDGEPTRSDDPPEDEKSSRDGSVASVGLSLTASALRLTVAVLAVLVRVLRAGVGTASRHLTDTDSRDRARRWLLLEGDRWTIVVGFVVGIFGIALVLGISDVIGVRESRFVTTMFSTMIAGLFSFIPIVVSVNQLIVSRLFGTPDRLTERIDSVHEFRARVESQTAGDGVSPTEPAPFLARLAGTLGERADSLVAVCESTDSDESEPVGESESEERSPALEAVCAFAERTSDHAETLGTQLTGTTTSVFGVVMPTMDHDYAASASEARRLRSRFDEDLSDRVRRSLSELRELYVTADATRQYFTTMYLQQELARLSRLITYSGTAALLLSTLVIMIYASGYPPVAHEGPLLVLVSLALAVAFSPLAVLFAYVVRIATILKRTSAPGAFTPPGERHGESEER